VAADDTVDVLDTWLVLDEEVDDELEADDVDVVVWVTCGVEVEVVVDVDVDVDGVDGFTTGVGDEDDVVVGAAAEVEVVVGACVRVVGIVLDEGVEEPVALRGTVAARRRSSGPGCTSRTFWIEARFCIMECLRTFCEFERTMFGKRLVRTVLSSGRVYKKDSGYVCNTPGQRARYGRRPP
jgi:hypothetical protein